MRKPWLIPILALLLMQAQPAADGFAWTTGATSAGFSLGMKYRTEKWHFGTRAAYFPGVGAIDLHAHRIKPNKTGFAYYGPEIIYLHDTVILTDRQFTSFEWVAVQGILGRQFHLSRESGFALEGGLGIRLYNNTTFVGAGAPIDLPISIIVRAEWVFGT
jgi:hypothetical protein